MNIILNGDLLSALSAFTNQVDWGKNFCTLMSSSPRLRFKYSADPSVQDPWNSGTEILNIGISSLTYDTDTGVVTVGKLANVSSHGAANLSSGVAAWRIESGSYSAQGDLGLTGSNKSLMLTTSPTANSGITLTSFKILPPALLPINADGVAIDGKVTDYVFQNTTGSTITNQAFTIGQAFKRGALPSSSTSLVMTGDTTFPVQMDVKNLYSDNSIQYAVLSGTIPQISANSSKSYNLVRKAAASSTPAVPSDFTNLTGSVTIVDSGTTYTANLSTFLTAGYTTWLAGDVASEWVGFTPLATSGGTAHPALTIGLEIRAYKGTNNARICVTIEHTKAPIASGTTIAHRVYDVTITLNGTTVLTKTSVPHIPYNRVRNIFWVGQQPVVHPRHNSTYLMATKATPNYNSSIVGATNTAAETSYLNTLRANKDFFQNGVALPYMPTTGGRPDIGLLPGWDCLYLLGMNPSMREVCHTQADLMGGWSVHYRDPATGQAVSAIDSPSLNIPTAKKYSISNISSTNPAVFTTTEPHGLIPGMQVYIQDTVRTGDTNTGVITDFNYSDKKVGAVTSTTFEIVGANTIGKTYSATGFVQVSNPNTYETSHVPAVAFLAYLTSGDYYHMEEMAFYGSASSSGQTVNGRQVRAQAWTLRDQARCAYMLPDNYRMKGQMQQLLNINRDDFLNRYVNNTNANKIGILVGGSAWSDPDSSGLYTRTWQDDFVTQSLGMIVELGFKDFMPIFLFKAKFVVSRMNFCRMLTCAYSMKTRSDSSSDNTVYATIDQVYAATYPVNYPSQGNNILGQVFDSAAMAQQVSPLGENNGNGVIANSMVGDAGNSIGYVANMQPALAYAATHGAPGAAAQQTRYEQRAVKQNNYDVNPQFNIVPRT